MNWIGLARRSYRLQGQRVPFAHCRLLQVCLSALDTLICRLDPETEQLYRDFPVQGSPTKLCPRFYDHVLGYRSQ